MWMFGWIIAIFCGLSDFSWFHAAIDIQFILILTFNLKIIWNDLSFGSKIRMRSRKSRRFGSIPSSLAPLITFFANWNPFFVLSMLKIVFRTLKLAIICKYVLIHFRFFNRVRFDISCSFPKECHIENQNNFRWQMSRILHNQNTIHLANHTHWSSEKLAWNPTHWIYTFIIRNQSHQIQSFRSFSESIFGKFVLSNHSFQILFNFETTRHDENGQNSTDFVSELAKFCLITWYHGSIGWKRNDHEPIGLSKCIRFKVCLNFSYLSLNYSWPIIKHNHNCIETRASVQ